MTFWQFAFKNVSRNSKAYFAYFVSSVFSITVFFSFTVYSYHPRLQDLQERGPLMNLIGMAQFVIIMFSFFFLLYSIGAFLNVRKKQFGILTILGISKKQLKRLVFMENMTIGILAIFSGIQIGLVFSNFFLLVTSKLTGVKGLYLYWPTKAIIITTITFIILFLIVSTFTPILIRTRKTMRLIKDDGQQKKERRPSILISLFGVACLVGCYYIAGVPENYVSEKTIRSGFSIVPPLSIIPLVTIGTYLLFSQTLFLFIWLLKKRRRFYMKKINMLWISDLATRTRGNINMLFIVTMLSALTFTIITSLFAMNNYTKAAIVANHPFPFTYISDEKNPFEKKHTDTIERELTNHEFQYKKHKFTVLKDQALDIDIVIMKESDYNQLSTLLNRSTIQLSESETYIVSEYSKAAGSLSMHPFEKRENITIESNKKTFHIKGFSEQAIEPRFALPYILVMQDYVVETMIPHIETMTIYNYIVENWEQTLLPTTNILKVTNEAGDNISKSEEQNNNTQTHIPFSIFTASDELYYSKQNNVSGFFIGAFLGVIFFMGAASVLYFRMYNDLTREEQKYITITKIGLTENEMFRSATIQLAILFFVPYIVAGIHTIFAIQFLQFVYSFSLLKELLFVLTLFGIVEIIFFFLIRSFYINKLSQCLKF
ncbi:FtsX-like permease family protein [Bacillus pseudomycoides]|uniref:FtsX-like permease family protein n=1 Tax=Bacillus pseudomycoides TaxID=64104 RepID=UPI000BED5DA6|nr:FtsX-like permease family protein [Bacillus pseudomycoides]PDY46499.1 ABC transporter permease [Bacillus pseudomycoides]PEA82104.1 ABC transporter permease [Bacillus pseudomycoides]PEI97912.1 ABC transporter permease [Bacillus pseudomycoides]PEM65214.1 ABC transporter permease [Bacillus pseudomycoides]PFZ16115.1 ABC transporter permease [Bacillus pseudomycoides]